MSSSFVAYLIGFIVLVVGLALGAHLAGVSSTWIGVGVIVLIGIGIVMAVTHTQAKTTPDK
jgi:positive regulator of sigma E activity